MAKYQDAEYVAQSKARIENMFNEADANGDGLHTLDEYINFTNAQVEMARELGTFVDERPGRQEWYTELYAITNEVTPDVDGVSISDWRAVIYYWMGQYGRLSQPA